MGRLPGSIQTGFPSSGPLRGFVVDFLDLPSQGTLCHQSLSKFKEGGGRDDMPWEENHINFVTERPARPKPTQSVVTGQRWGCAVPTQLLSLNL